MWLTADGREHCVFFWFGCPWGFLDTYRHEHFSQRYPKSQRSVHLHKRHFNKVIKVWSSCVGFSYIFTVFNFTMTWGYILNFSSMQKAVNGTDWNIPLTDVWLSEVRIPWWRHSNIVCVEESCSNSTKSTEEIFSSSLMQEKGEILESYIELLQ